MVTLITVRRGHNLSLSLSATLAKFKPRSRQRDSFGLAPTLISRNFDEDGEDRVDSLQGEEEEKFLLTRKRGKRIESELRGKMN